MKSFSHSIPLVNMRSCQDELICFEDDVTETQIIFNCGALACWRTNLFGPLEPEEELFKKGLVNRLLNLSLIYLHKPANQDITSFQLHWLN